MNLASLDLAVILLYFGGLAVFGLFVRRIRGFSDYSVAKRAVPASMILASLSATYIGPGYTMGLAGRAYQSGFLFFAFFLLFSLQTVLVGLFIAPRLNRFKEAHSLGDVMAELYGREAQVLTGVISVGLCIGFGAVMARAGGAVLSEILTMPLWAGVLLITGVGVLYTYTGGLKSVIATEAIQFVVMVLGISALVLFARYQVSSPTQLTLFSLEAAKNSFEQLSVFQIIGLALSFMLGEALIPPYANRALAAASGSISRMGFVGAGLFSILWFGMVIVIGIMGVDILGNGVTEDRVFMGVAATVLPPGLFGLVVIAVAAIVMSSQESVLNAAAVALTRDLVGPLRALTSSESLSVSRLSTGIFGVLAAFFALRAPTIIDGLLVCYSIWAPSVVPALLWGLVVRRTSRWIGFASMIGGVAGSASALLGMFDGDPATGLIVGLISSVVAPVFMLGVRRIIYGGKK